MKEAALMNLFSLRTRLPKVSNPRGIVLYWLFSKASKKQLDSKQQMSFTYSHAIQSFYFS